MDNVTCHSGFAYAERPVAFTWEGEQLEISSIQASWRIPEGRCFRVLTRDGRYFELSYSERNDNWQIRPI